MNPSIKSLVAPVVLALGGFAFVPPAAAQNVPADFSGLVEARLDGVVNVAPAGGAESEGAPAPGGSGFFVSRDGLAIAAAPALGGASDVIVTLADGSTVEGRVAATDAETGLAVIETAAGQGLPMLPWVESAGLSLGDWLVAIGRPQAETPTAAVGIVGALPGGVISSDLPIGPANAGGPVLNAQGRVVGVATIMPGPNDAPRPAILAAERVRETVRSLAQQVVEAQQPARLGVAIQPLDRGLASAFGVEPGTGVVVAAVEQGSAAAEAGLQPGDVITGFAGQQVQGPKHLRDLVQQAAPGEELSLTVVREGQEQSLPVTLAAAVEAPAETGGQANKAAEAAEPGAAAQPIRLGMRLLPVNESVAKELGIDQVEDGVLVMAVKKGAPAAAAGVRPGDIITAVGQTPVKTPEEIVSELESVQKAGNDTAALRVLRDGSYQFISVPV